MAPKRGFTGTFLKLIDDLENPCCNSNNNLLDIATENSETIELEGSGTNSNPLSANLITSPFSNIIKTQYGVATNNKIVSSSLAVDAVSNWRPQTTPLDRIWANITWSPDLKLLVATSHSGTSPGIMTSNDGIIWTTRTTPNNAWRSVAWSPKLKLFAAVSSTGTLDSAMTSPDGITWTSRTTPNSYYYRYLVWVDELELFIAVANTAGAPDKVMTSPDGINWTAHLAPDRAWSQIVWSPELQLLCVSATQGVVGEKIMTSPDGINWTLHATPGDAASWEGITWSSDLGIFCSVAYASISGTRVMTSPNGIDWTLRNTPADNQWLSVAWSPQLGLFAAVCDDRFGIDANSVMTSPNGVDWTLRTVPVVRDWRRIIWVKELGCFVALAYYDGSTPGGNLVMLSSLLDEHQQYVSIYGRTNEQSIEGDVSILGKTRLNVSEYANNAAAITAGLTVGQVYRTGEILKIVF